MNTTAIFVELLVIGIQAAIWVVLFAVSVDKDLPKMDISARLHDWEGLVAVGVFAACYSLGILVDRLADVFFLLTRPNLFIRNSPRLRRVHAKIGKSKSDVASLELAFHEGKASEYFEYFKARSRITRALTLNAFFITVASLTFGIAYREVVYLPLYVPIVAVVGGGVCVLSFLATGMLQFAYETRRDALERLLQEEKIMKQRLADKAQNPAAPADQQAPLSGR